MLLTLDPIFWMSIGTSQISFMTKRAVCVLEAAQHKEEKGETRVA